MRVLAGELKGRRLATARGERTRPTSDRVRIACLDTLMPYLAAGPFLDVFAGAGAVGIEALSRGAPAAVFVERDAHALRALRDNLTALGLDGRARTIAGDALRGLQRLRRQDERFAVVFLDPPYGAADLAAAVLAAADLVMDRGVLAIQHAAKRALPATGDRLVTWKTSKFGETALTFLRADR
jgi:16S rRNA (guanine(966)-N(2))-methyltransferase RsmD